jgi:uncharacterized membrane protein YfcA
MMAILGRSGERRRGLASRCASGITGALIGGLVATATGSTWLIALGGAILALFAFELASGRGGRGDAADRAIRLWAARGEIETLDRNW